MADTIGRYILLDWIGAGGMGVVCAAYDPELRRKVALKVLRTASERSSQHLLVREAQAMGQLSHPNVVTIYDIGCAGGETYIAMELVEGVDLARWLRGARRPWREVLKVLSEAGQGLAAAHALGIVHRDFKPANVLVGNDGRVCVTDFGLARTVLGPGAAPIASPVGGLGGVDSAPTLRRAGTPAYMAPEQTLGQETDARTDIYSFCLTLHEALFGHRPRAASSAEGSPRDRGRGRTGAPPQRARVPARLRRVIARGLRTAPDERHPSMAALLAELAAIRSRSRVRARARAWLVPVAALLLGTIAISGLAWHRGGERREQLQRCGFSEQELAAIWNPRTRATIRSRLLAAGAHSAGEIADAVDQTLERQAASWADLGRETCRAAGDAATGRSQRLERRMACLADRRQRLRAVTEVLAAADGHIVDRAGEIVQALESRGSCTDDRTLRAGPPLPADPRLRAEVEALAQIFARLDVLHLASRHREGLALAGTALDRARKLRHLPAEAEALFWVGKLQLWLGRPEGERTMGEALQQLQATEHQELAIRAWLNLAYWVGLRRGNYQQGMRWCRYASNAIRQAGGDDELDAHRLNTEGYLLLAQGHGAEALPRFERALALFTRWAGVGLFAARSLEGIALSHQSLGHADRALPFQRRSLAVREKVLGPNHEGVGNGAMHLAMVLKELRRLDEALAQARRAARIDAHTLGPKHPNLALARVVLADVLQEAGQNERAIELARQALPLLSAPAQNPAYAVAAHLIWGAALRSRGDYTSASALQRRALALLRERFQSQQMTQVMDLVRWFGRPLHSQILDEQGETLRRWQWQRQRQRQRHRGA